MLRAPQSGMGATMSEAAVAFEIEAVATSGDGAPRHRNGPGAIAIDPEGARALTRDVSARIDELPLAWDLATGAAVPGVSTLAAMRPAGTDRTPPSSAPVP